MSSSKTFSKSDVEQHQAKGDAWVVVDGYVYDVSLFSKLHPGGEHVLLQNSGQDASRLFHVYHNEDVLKKYHERLCIGRLEGYEKTPERVLYAEPLWEQRFNSPYYNDSHRRFLEDVRSFVDTELIPTLSDWCDKSKPPADIVQKMGKKGYLAILCGPPYPVQYVDQDVVFPEKLDPFHELIVIDQLCRIGHGGAIAAITNGPAIALSAVLRFGTDEQKNRVCNDVLMGRKYIALAISEPNAGSDVAGLQCSAKRKGIKKKKSSKFFCFLIC